MKKEGLYTTVPIFKVQAAFCTVQKQPAHLEIPEIRHRFMAYRRHTHSLRPPYPQKAACTPKTTCRLLLAVKIC
ncbi:hypothetical protein [Kingella denitrificans]